MPVAVWSVDVIELAFQLLGQGHIEKDARRIPRDDVNTLAVVGRLNGKAASSIGCGVFL